MITAIKTRGPLQGLEYMTPRTAQMTRTASGILIGSATVPRQRVEVTQDAEQLQRGLLGHKLDRDDYVGIAMILVGLAVGYVALVYGLPGGGL